MSNYNNYANKIPQTNDEVRRESISNEELDEIFEVGSLEEAFEKGMI